MRVFYLIILLFTLLSCESEKEIEGNLEKYSKHFIKENRPLTIKGNFILQKE